MPCCGFLKQKYPEKLLVESGLISRGEQGGRLFDRFRRRITFPIANDSGKIVAFGAARWAMTSRNI